MRVGKRSISLVMAAMLLIGGCSTDSADPPNAVSFQENFQENELSTDSSVVPATDAPVIADLAGAQQIAAIWGDLGVDPDVAECQSNVLVAAGYDQVADFGELTEVLTGLDVDQRHALDVCVTGEGVSG